MSLFASIVSRELEASRLVRMSSEQLAEGSELAKWSVFDATIAIVTDCCVCVCLLGERSRSGASWSS